MTTWPGLSTLVLLMLENPAGGSSASQYSLRASMHALTTSVAEEESDRVACGGLNYYRRDKLVGHDRQAGESGGFRSTLREG